MTDNPHADRLKNKPGTKDGKWGYDPYSRAMAQIDAIEAADKRKEPCIRTLADLLAAANLEEEEVSLGDITLLDIHAVLQSADKSDKSNGRLGLLAKLKEVGVTRLPHRQALASAACKAKKEGKLRPAKEVEAAADASAAPPEVIAPSSAEPAEAESQVAPPGPAATSSAGESDGGASSPAPAPTAAAAAQLDEVQQFTAGQNVKIIALVARPDLNGRIGSVMDFNAERGRYNVKAHGETIALKPVNLAVVPSAPSAVDVS